MKKSLAVLFIVILCVGFMNAQSKYATKGSWEIGGNVGLASVTPDSNGTATTSTLNINIMPFIGYFVADNMQIGFIPNIEVTSFRRTDFTFNLFVVPAYYFPIESQNLYPYVHALAGYSEDLPDDGRQYKGLSWGVGGGIKIGMGSNCLLNVGLDYIQYTYNDSRSVNRNGYNNLSVSAGFTVCVK
jgi:opacity protein-like surface antigen